MAAGSHGVHVVRHSRAMSNPSSLVEFAATPPSLLPDVVTRAVDVVRGDQMMWHSDIGCLELFGAPVVAADPFLVARWLGAGPGE